MNAFEWLIGLRYTRAKRRNGFISFISAASMVGIALGVMALITVLSVMNGFQREIRGRILEVASHIQVSGEDGRLADWSQVQAELAQSPIVRASAPYVQAQGLIAFDGRTSGAMLRGVLPEQENKVAGIGQHMVAGQLTALRPGEFGIVLGLELARTLGATVGDKITLITPQGNMSPAGMVPRLKTFTVVGLFRIDMYQYDAALALVAMADAQKLYRMGEQVSGVRLKIEDPLDAPNAKLRLAQHNPRSLWFSDWTQENANYFRMVQLEKRMMFLILTLIVAIATFNLVSSLVMTVTDKQADIAILRTMGASPSSILKIFMIQGACIGIFGTLAGVISGLLLAFNVGTLVGWLEQLLGTPILSAQVYFISELPSEVIASDVMAIAGISLFLAFIATLYPSWAASRIQPAEALRYE